MGGGGRMGNLDKPNQKVQMRTMAGFDLTDLFILKSILQGFGHWLNYYFLDCRKLVILLFGGP